MTPGMAERFYDNLLPLTAVIVIVLPLFLILIAGYLLKLLKITIITFSLLTTQI